MAILSEHSNQLAAVQLTKSYCLSSLLHACEIWLLRNGSSYCANVALDNSFRKKCCRQVSPDALLFHCETLPVVYIRQEVEISQH